MIEKLIDQLIYSIEQRIAAAYVDKKITEKTNENSQSYTWYVSSSGNQYRRISVECLGEVPISYSSSNGFVIFFTSEDTVHTVLLKIVKSEYKTAIINGILNLQDGSQRDFEMDLTGT